MRRALLALGASVLVVALVLLGAHVLGLEEATLALLARIERAGAIGALGLGACIVIATVAILPSAPLTFGAGLLYGPLFGAALVVSSATVGAVLAMLAARCALRGAVRVALARRPRLQALLALPGSDDWRLVAMLRVIPFFPFKLSNYALGLTPLSLRSFAFGTFSGLWPIALFNAWLGSLAGDLLALSTAARPHTALGWALQLGGLALCAVLTLVLVRRVTRALDAALADEGDRSAPPVSGGRPV